jgi:hypothetical protein
MLTLSVYFHATDEEVAAIGDDYALSMRPSAPEEPPRPQARRPVFGAAGVLCCHHRATGLVQ